MTSPLLSSPRRQSCCHQLEHTCCWPKLQTLDPCAPSCLERLGRSDEPPSPCEFLSLRRRILLWGLNPSRKRESQRSKLYFHQHICNQDRWPASRFWTWTPSCHQCRFRCCLYVNDLFVWWFWEVGIKLQMSRESVFFHFWVTNEVVDLGMMSTRIGKFGEFFLILGWNYFCCVYAVRSVKVLMVLR